MIKRPDILWMFHRNPALLPLNLCDIKKDGVYIEKSNALVKQNSIVEDAVSWLEMPVMIGKNTIGYVGRVDFDRKDGKLESIGLSQGVIAGAVLGKSDIKATDIEGYSPKNKAIMLKDGASIRETKKGAAETAGKATSYVIHKVKKTTPKVIDSMQSQSDKLHVMFKEFKDEVKKGMED